MSIIIGKDFFMNFCPICSSAEIIKTIPDDDNRERDVCQSCGEIFYVNPNIVYRLYFQSIHFCIPYQYSVKLKNHDNPYSLNFP